MRFYILLFTLIISANAGFTTNLKLSTPLLYVENEQAHAIINISWENAWNNDKNHDGTWLFFKSIPVEGQAQHIKLLPDNHEVTSNFSSGVVQVELEVSPDSNGVFIYAKNDFRGNINISLKIALDLSSFGDVTPRASWFRGYGIEMVYIPEGGFFLGEPEEKAREYGGLFQPHINNDRNGLIKLESERSTLEVAADGDLYYQNKKGYEGDQTGTIPASFPKGVASFYIMKYEITEGQYCTFINTLESDWREIRNVTLAKNYKDLGGTIYIENRRFKTPYENKPCQFTSWADAMAFADWAGLRPMTEFEFTKACRGHRKPVEGELPWGTKNKYLIQRMPNENRELIMNNGWGEEKLSDKNRAYFAASYYWVMDLSGSLWERMVSIGHPNGRSFMGSHGDGMLSENAEANNADWPSGEADSGGVGFRGGGFYGYNRNYHEYNPFSPIAYRPYGGWHGVMRSEAYGGRLVRTSYR